MPDDEKTDKQEEQQNKQSVDHSLRVALESKRYHTVEQNLGFFS